MLYLILIAITVLLASLYYYYSSCLPSESTNVKGKVVVCIGSTTGFGNMFVMKCLKEGMIVFASCNSPGGIDKLKKEAEGLPGQVFPFRMDIGNQESIEEGVAFVKENLPNKEHGIDALVNNAGIIRLGIDDWLGVDVYEENWRVNTLGIISVTHSFKEQIKAARGRIIICSSVCGRFALPGFGPYTVSKYALEAYADTIRELSTFGVSVSLVEPGFFRTPITTPDHITGQFDASWEKAEEGIRKQYGEEFKQKQNEIVAAMLTSPMNCPHPERVMAAYYHAATSPSPKPRYVVGPDAHLLLVVGGGDAVVKLINWAVGFPKPKEQKITSPQ